MNVGLKFGPQLAGLGWEEGNMWENPHHQGALEKPRAQDLQVEYREIVG